MGGAARALVAKAIVSDARKAGSPNLMSQRYYESRLPGAAR
jgi:hypothetical protein